MREYLAERKSVLLLAGLIMLVTLIPYLIGYAAQGEEWRFTGFVLAVEDGNSYIAKMQSGAAGEWLFRSPYSIEPQRGALLFLPYLLLGKLTSPPAQHEQLVALYHGFRFLAGMLAILASYDFLSMFVSERGKRIWGLIAVILGGGLGWLLVGIGGKNFLGSLPLDFLSPESFGFLGLLGFPHLALARALLLWGLVFYLSHRNGTAAGLLWLLMGFLQPLVVLIAWAVVGLHVVVLLMRTLWGDKTAADSWKHDPKSYFVSARRAVLLSSPLVVYTAYSFITDPYLQAWTAQNILPSPPWPHYLIAYGLVLPFAIGGTVKVLRREPEKGLLLAVWLLVFPVLVYAPVSTQRRLAEGIWPVMIAGFMAFFEGEQRLPNLARLLILFLLPTSILLVGGSIRQAANPDRPSFLPAEEVEVYLALRQSSPPDSFVLSEFTTGNSLPAWAPFQVVLGHGPETVHLDNWRQRVDRSLALSDQVDACGDLLLPEGIDYLFWGPAEATSWSWEPEQASCLRQTYRTGEYSLYQVAP